MSKDEIMNLREKLRYEFHKVIDQFYEEHTTGIEGSKDTTWEQVIDGALRDVLSDNEENIQDLEEMDHWQPIEEEVEEYDAPCPFCGDRVLKHGEVCDCRGARESRS